MGKHERNRFVSVYHSIIAILLLLAGGALIALGIWLQVTDNGGPLNLEYSGESILNVALNLGIGAIAVGGFVLFAAIASLIGMSRKCVGASFRVVYVIMAFIILIALISISAISFIIVSRGDSGSVRNFISEAWDRTVVADPEEVCEIEQQFECRGFDDDDCAQCVLGREEGCGNALSCAPCDVNRDPAIGCYSKIKENINDVFLPIGIGSAVVGATVLLDIFVTCLL